MGEKGQHVYTREGGGTHGWDDVQYIGTGMRGQVHRNRWTDAQVH